MEVEALVPLGAHQREHPLQKPLLWFLVILESATSEHKDILFLRVAMEVTEQLYLSVIRGFLDHLLHHVDLRVELLRGVQPLSV